MVMLLLDETVYIRSKKHPLIVVRSEGCSPPPHPDTPGQQKQKQEDKPT
jgi:hypothetical protein